jgi:hypothetical protein
MYNVNMLLESKLSEQVIDRKRGFFTIESDLGLNDLNIGRGSVFPSAMSLLTLPNLFVDKDFKLDIRAALTSDLKINRGQSSTGKGQTSYQVSQT